MQTALNILTIVAFLFSTYTFVRGIIENRKNISVELLQMAPGFTGEKQSYSVCFQILNKSRLPISISNIQIDKNGKKYEFFNAPIDIFSSVTRRNDTIIDSKKITSTIFPLSLTSLGGERVYLTTYKETDLHINEKEYLKIVISTNRGKLIKKVSVPIFCTSLDMYPSKLPERQSP